MTFFGFCFEKQQIEITEVFLRMSFGLLEPYEFKWYNGIKSVNVLIIVWIITAMSFHWFYNIEFRSSLIAQYFPHDIDDFDQVDIFDQGFYVPLAYKGFISSQFLQL